MNKEFTADSPDESAALALLWILKQEGERMTNCPYCGGEIPSTDFAVRTPEGNCAPR